ncbi:hypothetical protein CEXT_221161 [Caerostris extrusa]|uniref:Uncharacterized protein n=1 Tax=Caerostris extrusa TaxID=172846 RepID=A0AAV4MFK5_CAEEX|nr:hypothetical protein CEXT_221161 [Caerostris extrusa]
MVCNSATYRNLENGALNTKFLQFFTTPTSYPLIWLTRSRNKKAHRLQNLHRRHLICRDGISPEGGMFVWSFHSRVGGADAELRWRVILCGGVRGLLRNE